MNLFKVASVDEVKGILNKNSDYPIGTEEVDLRDSTGRILFQNIISDVDVPDFRRSTVDGYAVSSRDIAGASEAIPSILTLVGEVHMGETAEISIKNSDECIYVPTGGMVPYGADCVVMIEYTEKLDECTILVNSPAAAFDNVVNIGEDIKKGECILKSGTKLRPYDVGTLSSLGYSKVMVYKKIRVGIISTGDEVVDVNIKPQYGQIRDINTYLLGSMITQAGGLPVRYGILKDNYQLLVKTIDKALDECDILLISGGSSVGKKDVTIDAIKSLENSSILVHGISIKPGKPTIIGSVNKKLVFGLPGHPLACAVVFKVIVEHYMNLLVNHRYINYPTTCTFSLNYHKAKGREEYLPVTLELEDGKIIAQPIFTKSGLMSGFSRAYGYIKIEKNVEGLREGQEVNVYKL